MLNAKIRYQRHRGAKIRDLLAAGYPCDGDSDEHKQQALNLGSIMEENALQPGQSCTKSLECYRDEFVVRCEEYDTLLINFCQKPATYQKVSSLLEQEIRLANNTI